MQWRDSAPPQGEDGHARAGADRPLRRRSLRAGYAAGAAVGLGPGPRRSHARMAVGRLPRRDPRAGAGMARDGGLGAGGHPRRPVRAGHPPGAPRPAAVPAGEAHPPQGVGDRARGAGRRHHRLRRRAVLRSARLEQAARGAAHHADRGGEGLPRRAHQRAVPHGQRLDHPPQRQGDPQGGLGFRKAARLPGHAHLQGARRPRVLAAGPVPRPRSHRLAFARRVHHRHGAELARPRRADREIRHARAEGALPAAPRPGAGGTVLLAHRPDLRLRRRDHARCGLCHARDARGPGGRRHPIVLGEALHHAGAECDAGGPRLPRVRP